MELHIRKSKKHCYEVEIRRCREELKEIVELPSYDGKNVQKLFEKRKAELKRKIKEYGEKLEEL